MSLEQGDNLMSQRPILHGPLYYSLPIARTQYHVAVLTVVLLAQGPQVTGGRSAQSVSRGTKCVRTARIGKRQHRLQTQVTLLVGKLCARQGQGYLPRDPKRGCPRVPGLACILRNALHFHVLACDAILSSRLDRHACQMSKGRWSGIFKQN